MMRNDSVVSLSNDPVLLAAAEWFERLHNAEPDADAVSRWQEWLAEKPEHKRAFDEYIALSQRLEAIAVVALPAPSELAADSYDAEESVADWLSRNPCKLATPAVAPRTPRWKSAGLAAGILAALGAVYWHVDRARVPVAVAMYETKASEHRRIQLPDGSTLSLGAKSLALTHFTGERREVVLSRGEAYFEVAKDQRRPFTVDAGITEVTAVGTAFNVRRSGERVHVAVSEGVVNVSPNSTSPVSAHERDGVHRPLDASPGNGEERPVLKARQLRAGQQVAIEPEATTLQVRDTNPRSVSAWQAGRLEYLAEPLRYVVADVNRYSPQEIAIEDERIGDLLITGTVLEDDIAGWLKSLEAFLPVRVVRSENGRVQLTAKHE